MATPDPYPERNIPFVHPSRLKSTPLAFDMYKQAKRPRRCYSCMSEYYQRHWHQLSPHYYPPRNFTDMCDDPQAFDPQNAYTTADAVPSTFGDVVYGYREPTNIVATEECDTACVTIIENFSATGKPDPVRQTTYMRGCMSRFLLFEMSWELQREWAPIGPRELCRISNRHYLHLINVAQSPPLTASDPAAIGREPNHSLRNIIQICSCTGDKCNRSTHKNMASASSAATQMLAGAVAALAAGWLRSFACY